MYFLGLPEDLCKKDLANLRFYRWCRKFVYPYATKHGQFLASWFLYTLLVGELQHQIATDKVLYTEVAQLLIIAVPALPAEARQWNLLGFVHAIQCWTFGGNVAFLSSLGKGPNMQENSEFLLEITQDTHVSCKTSFCRNAARTL